MNCKPGDLAVVISAGGWGAPYEALKRAIGSIVRVVRLQPPDNTHYLCLASQVWVLEKPLRIEFDGHTFTISGIADSMLQPIRGLPTPETTDKPVEIPA